MLFSSFSANICASALASSAAEVAPVAPLDFFPFPGGKAAVARTDRFSAAGLSGGAAALAVLLPPPDMELPVSFKLNFKLNDGCRVLKLRRRF